MIASQVIHSRVLMFKKYEMARFVSRFSAPCMVKANLNWSLQYCHGTGYRHGYKTRSTSIIRGMELSQTLHDIPIIKVDLLT